MKKHKIVVALLSLCLLGGAIGVTYAYYQAQTELKKNTFSIGNVTTEITEEVATEGNKITKKPVVTNTGKNDCYIRMRVTVSPEGAADITGWSENWTDGKDGFYYYQTAVAPKGKTDAIFTGANLKKGFTGDFEITCYQEAVQAEARVDGTITKNIKEIWAAYDKQTAVFGTAK